MLSNKSARYSLRQLARHFNCAPNTIRNELKRGAHHNGSEFAKLAELENNTTTKVYFAHPYSSQERDFNERHNGLLRRLVPKGRSIDKYTSDDILFTADWCNLLPRKILGYKTPDNLFENELDKIYAA